jgi:adenylate cyclase class IV
MKKEVEAKFLNIEKDSTREQLRSSGFTLITSEYLMKRKTFKFPQLLPKQSKWGRVRQEAGKVTMTIKEVRGVGINDTYEAEVIVNDFAQASSILEACGLIPNALQENLREVWKRMISKPLLIHGRV